MLKGNVTNRAYANGPFGQIHFQHFGAGGSPLLLLHQAPMMSGQFDTVYAPLAARGIHAIGIDMPGFGMSDPAPALPKIEDFAECVEPVLDALGIERSAILGHHTGSLAATEAAIRHPHRITSIILNGPLPLDDKERSDFMERHGDRLNGVENRENAQQFVEVFQLRSHLARGSIPVERLCNYVAQTFMGSGEYWYGHHAAYQYRHEDRLPLIRQPGLILTNTGDVIYEHAKRAWGIRPDMGFVALDGGGVDIVDQQPEAWADTVAAFVQSQTQ